VGISAIFLPAAAAADPFGAAAQGYVAFPVRGVALCVTWAFWGICDQYWIIYNKLEIYVNAVNGGLPLAENYELNVRKIMGHELGHTTGMVPNNGPASNTNCAPVGSGPADPMRSGNVHTNNAFLLYNAHHVSCHINEQY
jgi:hypothetical protein